MCSSANLYSLKIFEQWPITGLCNVLCNCDFQYAEELRMDIFTTQLTRVVPVPIKPASLKVKALLKEAANSKLHQDPDHVEYHEYYFAKEEDQHHPSQQREEEKKHAENINNEIDVEQKAAEVKVEKTSKDNKGNTKHLDLYA